MNDLTIPAELDRRPLVGSFTLLKNFRDICEHQTYRKYIRKDIPYTETPAQKFGTAAHEAFKKRISQGIVLPDDMQQWDKFAAVFDAYEAKCELQLGLTKEGKAVGFWDGATWFRGKIDVVVVIGSKALITDWKFGSSKYEDPFELETNALLVKARWPDVTKIVGRYVYPKENQTGPMHDLSDFEHTWQEVHRLMAAIEEKKKSGEWIKRKSGLCGWCDVKDCEHWFRK